MRFAFLAGLPRSGSSLLANLLGQHPKLHVSPTSGVIDMMVWVRNNWLSNDAFRAQGADEVQDCIRDMLRGMLFGYYSRWTPDGGNVTVVDRNRAWPAYIEMMEDILGRKITIICTVRDILEVFASFERLRMGNPLTYPQGLGEEYLRNQSVYGRFDLLMGEGGVIGLSGLRMLDAIQRGLGDRLLIVPYERLMADPVAVCANVHLCLGVKPQVVCLDELYEDRHYNDVDVWGAPLHKVGGKFDPLRHANSKIKAGELPNDLVEMANTRYPGINRIARQDQIVFGDALKEG